jgi:hypothetical protein
VPAADVRLLNVRIKLAETSGVDFWSNWKLGR